jgi:hypothetical protein
MVVQEVTYSFTSVTQEVIFYLPKIIAAAIILIIGWLIGRAAGKLVAALLDRMGVDDAVEKTFLGSMISRSKMTVKGVFDALVRWFIYIIFIMAAINVLDIPVFTQLLSEFVLYLPQFISGVLILVIGLILVNFVMNWIKRELQSSDVAFADMISTALMAFFSLVVIILALDQMLIDTQIIYTFLGADCMGTRTWRSSGYRHRRRTGMSKDVVHGLFERKERQDAARRRPRPAGFRARSAARATGSDATQIAEETRSQSFLGSARPTYNFIFFVCKCSRYLPEIGRKAYKQENLSRRCDLR